MAARINMDLAHLPIDKMTGCILWPYTKSKFGYARKKYKGKLRQVSRILLELKLNRPIGNNLCALHSCDNPGCVNPDHLREGTRSENMLEMWTKKRHRLPQKMFPSCTVAGCNRPHCAKGLCNTHYKNIEYHEKNKTARYFNKRT